MITDKTLKMMAIPELWDDPRNLISVCCMTGCPTCGQSCHFKIWHHGNFRETDKMISEVFAYKVRLIEWIENVRTNGVSHE